jgi:gamma-glutamylcyclotransferase (GGCT)/AIG2-like uncharacterized protein YtfP
MNTESPSPILLFVYGTLMRGYGNHHRLAHCPFLGKAITVAPFGLYDCGSCPGMVKAGKGGQPILGEVYQIDGDTLASCDRLEGHPHFYKREEIEVDVEDGKKKERLVALAYFIQPPGYLHWKAIGNQWPARAAKKGS